MFHMIASRWPKWLPFHPGWLTHSEVVRGKAERIEGPYRFCEVILPARGAAYWDGCITHNPTLRSFGGKFYLFYTGSQHPFEPTQPGQSLTLQDPRIIVARSRKRIGIAVAERLEGPWKRFDTPILETQPDSFFNFLTSNAAPWINPDSGETILLFKCRAYQGTGHGPMRLGLARAPHPLGPYRVIGDKPVIDPEVMGELEDPFLWKQSGQFHFIAKAMKGGLTGQRGAAIHAVSEDAENWTLGEPPLAYRKEILWEDGVLETFGSMERPFLYVANGVPTHLCAAVSNGSESFSDATDTWNAVIPLKPSE